MRIVQVLPSMRRAGAESAVATLCAALAREPSVELHLAVLGGRYEYASELRDKGVHVHLLDLFEGEVPFYRLAQRRRIRSGAAAFLRSLEADVLHFHLQHALVFGAGALRSAPACFYTFHSLDPIFSGGDWRNRLRQFAFRRAARRGRVQLLGVSPSVARHCAAGMRVPLTQVTVQPNALDLRKWAAVEPAGLSSSRIAMVGTLYPLKRTIDGIAALAALARQGFPFTLVVIGDGPERVRLQRHASDAGVADRVRFLGKREDVAEQLRECGALWLLSEREGHPMAAIEAMALGLPVVASSVPGTSDLVSDGENGLLVPLGDTSAVAARTLQLWRDGDLYRRLAANGRATAERFEAARVARSHLDLYRQALERQTRHAD